MPIFNFNVEKINENEYRTIIKKDFLKQCGVKPSDLRSPTPQAVSFIKNFGDQIVTALVESLKEINDPNADKLCDYNGYVTNEGIIYNFIFYDEDDIEYAGYDQDSDEDDYEEFDYDENDPFGIFNEFLDQVIGDYNKSIENLDHATFFFESLNDSIGFISQVYDLPNNICLVKHNDEFGVFVASDLNTISIIRGYAAEFNGFYTTSSLDFFEEKGEVIADKLQLCKMIRKL